ncbi:MAG: hypothetical protein EP343_28490 [Deltaproteobacteria bacterium]|nr:MAG: hypothetical protein EP343_28490 [Deltaproteobacteria bacterium]
MSKKSDAKQDTQMLSQDDLTAILELYAQRVAEQNAAPQTLHDASTPLPLPEQDLATEEAPGQKIALGIDPEKTVSSEDGFLLPPPAPLPSNTMGMGSFGSNVFVFFTDSDYDKETSQDTLHRAYPKVNTQEIQSRTDWPQEKLTFVARFQLCMDAANDEATETIFMGDSSAFDAQLLRWDAAAVAFHKCCHKAKNISVRVEPKTGRVAMVARQFPVEQESTTAVIDESFLIDAVPIDYLRYDGVLQLDSGHPLISLADEALRVKVLCVRDGIGLGGFRLPSRYRLDGLILQGCNERKVYLSQVFANQRELAPDDRLGRRIDYIHLGKNVDLGEGVFPVPPMKLKVMSVQYPHDLDKLAELLESWEGSIEKLVLWGYSKGQGHDFLHKSYPLFMALATHNKLPVKRFSWIESNVGSQTFEWIRFSDIDCQIFGEQFQHLSVDQVDPGQLMMVLRGFGQSLSPGQIETYISRFHSSLSEVPIMVKRLFFGTQNFSISELQEEVQRIQSEQENLWSRIEGQVPTPRRPHSGWHSDTTDPGRPPGHDTVQGHVGHWKDDS